MPRSHIHKWWRNLKPALAIPTQWPSKVAAPRCPSSILAKLPAPPAWTFENILLLISGPHLSGEGRCGLSLCWKAVGIYPPPSASSECDTLLLATKGCFIHKVNARAGRSRVKPRDSVAVLPGLKSHACLDLCRVQSGSGRKGSHVVMQESSAASRSQRRMQELPVHQKIPSIRPGGWCNSTSTWILSVATVWDAEGDFCVTFVSWKLSSSSLWDPALWIPAGTVLSWTSSPASVGGNLGIYFSGGFPDSSQPAVPLSDPITLIMTLN